MAKDVKFYQTPEFKKLNQQWQKKLKATGFKDLEDPDDPDAPIPDSLNPRSSRYKSLEQTADYYQKALHYLEHGEFTSLRQKAMWRMHCDGASLAEIAKDRRISKTAVDYHIQTVKKKMYGGQSND